MRFFISKLAVNILVKSMWSTPTNQFTTYPKKLIFPAKEKPWGTGHAVWCARDNLANSSFAVINADDFYGTATFRELISSISQFDQKEFNSGKICGAIIGYFLNETLSDHGSVSRGLCKIKDGKLRSVEEWSGIARSNNRILGKDSHGNNHQLFGDEIVSMNVWAFPPAVSFLSAGIFHFFESSSNLSTDEFYLPAAVDNWISEGRAEFNAGIAKCKWLGVTYREDKPVVSAAISEMISKGEYPASLLKKNRE